MERALSLRWRRRLGRLLSWVTLAGCACGVTLLYRWADPINHPTRFAPPAQLNTVSMRLENAPFTAYSEGRKSWSLRAKRIEVERLPGATLANIQSANIADLRDGALYATPSAAEAASLQDAPPVAVFSAQKGRYTLGETDPVPDDLQRNYAIQWQFLLTGSVAFTMRNGDRLEAPALTILEMRNRNTNRLERRILCMSGATVRMKQVTVKCNRVRYDPAERTLECLEGVRATFQSGFVQSERLYWTHQLSVLRCPDSSAGRLRDLPFRAEGLTVDLKNRVVEAAQVEAEIHRSLRSEEMFRGNRVRPAVASLLALGGVAGATPQPQEPKASETSAAKKPYSPTKVGLLVIKSGWRHEEKTQTGTGRDFRYVEEDMSVTGAEARYDNKQDKVWANGNLVMEDPEQRITANKAEIDNSKKKLAILTENVVITLKSKKKAEDAPTPATAKSEPGQSPSAQKEERKEDRKEARSAGVIVHCERVEYTYDKKRKRALLSGNLVFTQTIKRDDGKTVERTLTALRADYNGSADKMLLFKPVTYKDSEGREATFEENVTVGTKEGEETLETDKGVELKTPVEEEENEDKKPAPPRSPR